MPRGASCAPTLDARFDKHTVEHQGDAAHGGGRVSVRSLPQPRALSSRGWQDRLFCPSHISNRYFVLLFLSTPSSGATRTGRQTIVVR